MANRGHKYIWKDTMEASGAINKWGIVNLSSSGVVVTPTAVATAPYGIALDDAADGEPVEVLRIGRCYGIDTDGDLNNGDYVSGKDNAAEYHKLETATVGTTAGIFGRVVGEDGAAADDLLLIEVDFIRHDK